MKITTHKQLIEARKISKANLNKLQKAITKAMGTQWTISLSAKKRILSRNGSSYRWYIDSQLEIWDKEKGQGITAYSVDLPLSFDSFLIRFLSGNNSISNVLKDNINYILDNLLKDNKKYTVINPFSEEAFELTGLEYKKYIVLKLAEKIGDHEALRSGLDWFIENNIDAYSVLLD